MALRNMNIDIGFKVNEGPLKRADKAADDFKDNVEDGTSSLDNLGSQAETAGSTIRDEFEDSTDSVDELGYRAEDAGDSIVGAGEDAADSMQDLGSQSENAGEMISDASEDAADSIQDLGYQSEDTGDMITDSSSEASDSLEDIGNTAGEASNVITVEFGNAADSVDDLGSQAGDTADVISDSSSYAADSLSGIGAAAGDAGSSVSAASSEASDGLGGVQQSADDTGEGFKLLGIKADKWIKGVAIGAIVALGGAFIAAAADATTSMMEIEDSMYVFQAETGSSIEVAEEFSEVLKDLHTNNTDSYGELADAATTVSQRFDVEGEALQNLTQDYLDYTKVTGQSEGAIEGLSRIQKQYGIETDGASDMLDKFLSVAQETGAPVETLQRNIEQMGPSLQAAGFSLDETLGLLGMFEESGVDSQRALRGLRTAMTSVENPEDLKDAVFDLMEMTDESERTTEALDLFGGTAGTQMARALGEGREAFDEMLGTVSESEGVVSTASEAFDQQFGERFTLLTREVLDPFRETVGPKMTEAMSGMMDWVEGNLPKIQAIAEPIFDGIATAIGFAIEHFDILGPAIATALFVMAVPAFVALGTAAWGAAAGVIAATWPIIAIGLAVGAVVGVFIWAWQNWEQITEWFGIAVDWLGEKFSIGLQFIQDFFVNSFTFIRDFGINLWTGFSEGVLGIWDGFTTGITNFVTSIGDGISSGFQSAVDFGLDLWTGFKDGVLGIWDGLVGGIRGFVNSIISAINSMIGGINSVQIDIPGWVSKIPGVPDMESIGFNIPKIPMLADGGMVTDATLSVIGEGADNEAVLPLNRRIFNFLGRGIVNALGFSGLFNRNEPDDEPGPSYVIITDEPDDDQGPEPIIIIDEPDDGDGPDDDGPYPEYSDYEEYNSASEYNDYSVEIKEIHINVSGTATREDGRKVGQGFKEYMDEHYGSLGRRVLTNQEG